MECIKNKCKYYQDHLFNASCFECNLGSRTYKKEYVIDCIIDEKIGDLSDRIRELYKQRDIIVAVNSKKELKNLIKCTRCGVYTINEGELCDDCLDWEDGNENNND